MTDQELIKLLQRARLCLDSDIQVAWELNKDIEEAQRLLQERATTLQLTQPHDGAPDPWLVGGHFTERALMSLATAPVHDATILQGDLSHHAASVVPPAPKESV